VIFDSTVTPGEAKAVYVEATAEIWDDIDVYVAEEARQGIEPLTPAEVAEGARHRMYRAAATALYTLDGHDERVPQVV
jgi:hypothetical protein